MAKRTRKNQQQRKKKRGGEKNSVQSSSSPMLFGRLNYTLLIAGVVLIFAGFTVMRLENEVYGFVSLYVAPLIIAGGYITVIVSILKRNGASGVSMDSMQAANKISDKNTRDQIKAEA